MCNYDSREEEKTVYAKKHFLRNFFDYISFK